MGIGMVNKLLENKRCNANTSWSGSYGGSGGSSSVDGQGNKNITMSCPSGNTYSATFNKKDNSEDTPLTLNVIQNATGGKTIFDPYTHETPYYPIITHQVVVNNQTTTAHGIVSAFGIC
jgi:hypothetical protein